MDLRKIKKLIELVEESGITEIEVKSGDEAVRIVRPNGLQSAAVVPATPSVPDAIPVTAVAQDSAVQSKPRQVSSDPACLVNAPLTGTFYRSSSPEEAPYVTVGQKVKVGDVLCIIESMKMMNLIEAEQAGLVTSILVEDGVPVQEEQALFTIE